VHGRGLLGRFGHYQYIAQIDLGGKRKFWLQIVKQNRS
jgi:hypothetical protein